MRVYFWILLCSIAQSVFTPMLHCLNDFTYVISLEFRQCKFYNFALLQKHLGKHGVLVVSTLPFNAGNVGSIPGQGAGIPHALQPKKKKKKKQKQYCNKFSTFFSSVLMILVYFLSLHTCTTYFVSFINTAGIFIGITLKLYINWGEINIFTILSSNP